MKRILLFSLFSIAAMAQSVTAVLDGGAYTANIAQGSVFVVKGTGLSGAGYVAATAPIYPTVLNNVSIRLTAVPGGAVVNALMVYTYNLSGVNQLSAVLPSTAAAGAYDLRVTNGSSTSAAFRTNVQARKPGIVTASSDGLGEAQATIGNELTLVRQSAQGKIGSFDTRPIKPNEYLNLWGTGLGPDVSSDTGGTNGDQTGVASIRVLLDGTEITPYYAGRSQGYPGLDQIIIIIPANVTLRCANTIQVRSGGVLSNTVTIATSNGSACSNPGGGGGGGNNTGLTQAQIDAILAKGFYNSGGVSISRTTTYTTTAGTTTTTRGDTLSGSFSSISGPDLPKLFGTSTLPAGFTIPAPGVCNVFTTTNIPNVATNIISRSLDAGANVTARGPAGTRVAPRATSSGSIFYNLDAGNGTPGNFMDPGNYTFTGPGGPDVGSFSLSVDVAPELVWTNRASMTTINRASGATITWTGGEPSQLIFISGTSIVVDIANPSNPTGASFQCYANQSAGTFTIPSSILNQMPASTELFGFAFPGTLSISSVGKITFGTATGLDSLSVSSTSSTAQSTTYR
jgi:uncharacterized protein (TIGR03437 family)